ncbi:GSDA2 protein, partial [Leucopsar rothschildi]|nr:GSDA2 protein [Leucopsar rothschildi]
TLFISAELMDDQLLLLLESLERKILYQQLNLVRVHITLGYFQGGTDYFNSSSITTVMLLSFPHKEEQMLTMELVELSGVQLQEDGSAVPRDQPFEALAALFAALYALNFLSG